MNKMTKEELIQNISYLQKKYLPGREDLVELLKKENDAIKYVLTKFYILGEERFSQEDKQLIKDINFNWC